MNRARKPQLFLIALTALALAALACNLGTSGERTPPPPPTAIPVTPDATSGAGELSQQQRSALIAATVQIYGMQNKDGRLAPIYTGSGTLLSPDGLILTNAHVASPASQGDAAYEPDALVISLVREEDAPAVASYIAELMAVDGYLDLAVIKVSSTLDGSRVQGSQLNLPYVPLGDSNQIHVGDNLNIFGFPGIGGDTITFTKGSVSGFTPEEGIGNRAWIKTDATIAGGNSGGLGADSRGQIIGVPTRASSGAAGEITDCRVVQDTNGDGRLDQQDTCIPIGGFINALRPVELARPLIEAAQSGVEYVSPFGSAGGQGGAGGSGQEQIGNLRWAAGADSNGDPVGLTEAFPAGTSEIYAFFDYAGFTDGQDFSAEWYIDGQMVAQDVSPWDGGSQGTYYLRLFAKSGVLDDGVYEVKLYVGEGLPQVAGAQTTVGSGGQGGQPGAGGDVTIEGQITDADTGQGIPGALFIVLQPGTDPQQWMDSGSDAEIVIYAEADANGRYTVSGLQREVSYSVVVGLKGYQPKWSSDFTIGADEPQVVTVDVELQR